jgi:hypothetical protein
VTRHEYGPRRHEYLVTEQAIALWLALYATQWGERYHAPNGPPAHLSTAGVGPDTRPAPAAMRDPARPAELETSRPGAPADVRTR